MTSYDVLVIGSGAAGQTVAAACAKAGKSVAVVDRRPFGGTCALRGCLPKKVLLAGSEASGRTEMLAGRGITGSCAIDWPALMAFKRSYTDPVPSRTEAWMRDMGIDVVHGTARFTAPSSMDVNGEDMEADAFVLATGSRPATLGIEGEDAVSTSTDFLALDQMPRRVAFIGGGYISFEFAGLAHRAGARVSVLHRSAQVLAGFDPTLADMLARRYRSLGIEVLTNAPVEAVERTRDGLVVVTPAGRVEADLVVHGAGRIPDLDDLALDVAGVDHSPKGVTVDNHLRSTSNPGVWAAGDAADAGTPLTPVAGAQGEVVAANILGGEVTFDDAAIPSVVFSDPPMARVGLGAEVTDRDERLETRVFDMGGWFTQTRVGNDTAAALLVLDRETGAIRGAHLLGIGTDEVINVFTLAVKFGISLERLRTVTWAYPTFGYDINYLTGRY